MANKGTDLDNVVTNSSNQSKPSDKVTLFKFPEAKWVTFRAHGPIYVYGGYWIKTKTKEGKESKFYTAAPSWDSDTQQRDSTKYDPWRDLEASQSDLESKNRTLNFSTAGYMNMILRLAQRQAPAKLAKHTSSERKTGFKDKDSDSYSPNTVVRLPYGAMVKFKEQSGLNVVEVRGQTKTFAVTHPKFGCDIRIKYDSTKAPADQYQFSIGVRTPITEEELAYLKWDLSNLESPPVEAEVKRDYEGWAKRNGIKVKSKKKPVDDDEDEDFADDDGDDEDEVPAKKGKSKPAKKSSKKPVDDDEDFDDDSDEDDEDEDDEDDEPPAKKKVSAKGKKKPVDDDEDFDDDFDDDSDEDEDDEPPAKKKVAAKSKKKPVDDDEDEDFADDDGDDEDEVPAKKKVAAKSKKKPVDDDEDDDFDDDEEDEDDEPPAKKKKVVPKKSSKKPVDEDDEDEDLDEDDEPPAKKKVAAKGKKKPPVDDDDDFDDDEEDEDDEPPPKKKVVKKSR